MTNEKLSVVAGIYIAREVIIASRTVDVQGGGNVESLKPPGAADLSNFALDRFDKQVFTVDRQAPLDALSEAIDWICSSSLLPSCIGVGCYGPFKYRNDDPDGAKYQHIIRSSSREPFEGRDLLDTIKTEITQRLKGKRQTRIKIRIETDVNVCALGEYVARSEVRKRDGLQRLGPQDVFVVGHFSDGVGGSIVKVGEIFEGRQHSEMGHIPVFPHPSDFEAINAGAFEKRGQGDFKGGCSRHYFCLENFASRRALEKRAEPTSFDQLKMSIDHPAWDIQAYYIAQFCFAAAVNYAPTLIALGGLIVQETPGLIEKVQDRFDELWGRNSVEELYLNYLEDQPTSSFIVRTGDVDTAALGTLALAMLQNERGGVQSIFGDDSGK